MIQRSTGATSSTGAPARRPSASSRWNASGGTSMEIYPDFRDLLTLFNAREVEYVVVGGYAVAHHGAPRYTADIDLFVRASDANAARILDALKDFGFGSLGLDASDFNRPHRVTQLGFPPCRVDIVTSIDGVTFSEVAADVSPGTYGDVAVPYIGRAALLRNRRASGRAKDIADAEVLEPRPGPRGRRRR